MRRPTSGCGCASPRSTGRRTGRTAPSISTTRSSRSEAGQGTALLGRGEVLAETGDLSGATQSFEQIIGEAKGGEFAAVDPQLEAAYYGLGSVMLKRHQAKDRHAARRRRRSRSNRRTPTPCICWGGPPGRPGPTGPRSRRFDRRSCSCRPAGVQPYEELSKAYRAQHRKPYAEYAGAMVDLCEKRPDDAMHRLKRLTSGPVAVDAMLGLGMAAEVESHRASASRWYRKVVAVDPQNFNARSGLSRLSARHGRRMRWQSRTRPPHSPEGAAGNGKGGAADLLTDEERKRRRRKVAALAGDPGGARHHRHHPHPALADRQYSRCRASRRSCLTTSPSIYGIDAPMGVAVSPSGDRIYVTESEGRRLVRVFDSSGDQVDTLKPPGQRGGACRSTWPSAR